MTHKELVDKLRAANVPEGAPILVWDDDSAEYVNATGLHITQKAVIIHCDRHQAEANGWEGGDES